MRKIVVIMDAGFVGTDAYEAYTVPDDVSDEELSEFAWMRGKEHAESYGIYPRSEYEDCNDISEEELDGDEYSDNIEGYWEPYDSEKHDGHLTYGSEEPTFMEY